VVYVLNGPAITLIFARFAVGAFELFEDSGRLSGMLCFNFITNLGFLVLEDLCLDVARVGDSCFDVKEQRRYGR